MITIFTNPRPFEENFDIIQRNAIKSWKKFGKGCQIILFEDEKGTTSKVADEYGLECIKDSKFNEYGTPLFNDAVEKAKNMAKFDIVANINPDIILMSDFFESIDKIKKLVKNKKFLIVGRRCDLDFLEKVDLDNNDFEKNMNNLIKEKGVLHGFSALDYLVFPKDFDFYPPAFAIGRSALDNWMVFQSRLLKADVIDASDSIKAIHQNHDFARFKKINPIREKERIINVNLAGGFLAKVGTIRDANLIFNGKKIMSPQFPRKIFPMLTLFMPWRLFLSLKRKLNKVNK